MKNKGRKHLASNANCKGCLTFLTRPIEKMSTRRDEKWSSKANKLRKRAWSKRVRGYFKTQHFQDIENYEI